MGTTYLQHPKPSPDMDAGRSATKVGESMKAGGQDAAAGAMGKNTKTGDGMENESGVGKGKKKGMKYGSHNPGHKG